jgi:hypothetical protein
VSTAIHDLDSADFPGSPTSQGRPLVSLSGDPRSATGSEGISWQRRRLRTLGSGFGVAADVVGPVFACTLGGDGELDEKSAGRRLRPSRVTRLVSDIEQLGLVHCRHR